MRTKIEMASGMVVWCCVPMMLNNMKYFSAWDVTKIVGIWKTFSLLKLNRFLCLYYVMNGKYCWNYEMHVARRRCWLESANTFFIHCWFFLMIVTNLRELPGRISLNYCIWKVLEISEQFLFQNKHSSAQLHGPVVCKFNLKQKRCS